MTGTATSAGYVQSLRQNDQVNGVYGTSILNKRQVTGIEGTSDIKSVESGELAIISICCRHLLIQASRFGLCDRDRSRQ